MSTNRKFLFKFSKTFETGLSDHHEIISITIKSGSFKRLPKKKKIYRCYKNFDMTIFGNTLKRDLQIVNDNNYKSFENIFKCFTSMLLQN